MRVIVFTLVVLFAVGIALRNSYPDNLPFLKTRGTDIVTEGGERVFLRGVNLGGWLLWEGGVYGLPNFAEHKLCSILQERLDKERVDLFFDLVRENFILPEDITRIKEMRLNFIRLPFHYRYIKEGKFTKLDEVVKWAKERGIYVILDMHAAPGAQNTDYHSDSDGTAHLWESSQYQDEFIRLWEILVKRYKDEPAVFGFELLNEPATDNGKLTKLYVKAISRIRKIDNRHIIFLDGNNYASDFSLFGQSFGDNIVYVFHTYAHPQEVQEAVDEYRSFQKRFEGPMMCSEYGNPGLSRFFEGNDIHWAPWTYKAHLNEAGFYSPPDDNPWRLWLEDLGAKKRKNKQEIKEQWLKVINKSSLSQDCRQELIDVLDNQGSGIKELFFAIGKKYSKDSNELRRVYLRLMETANVYQVYLLADSLQAMSESEIKNLTESLQTKYWKK